MARFVPNPLLTKELEASEGVQHALEEKAQKGAEFARSIAPVVTGTFRDSIHADGNEIVADPVNSSGEGYGAFVEFGTSDTPAHATLRRAADALKAL